jgi:adenosine deaminase
VIIQIVVYHKSSIFNYYLRLDAITRVMYEVCEDAVNDGVKYLEVRFSPILHVNGNITTYNKYEFIQRIII